MNDVFDWNLLTTGKLNTMLCGDRARLSVALSRLGSHLDLPLHAWSFAEGSPLPSMTKGTLIISDLVDATLAEQTAFLEWLTAHRAVRIITLSEIPLFDFVATGEVLGQLYYRLNPIYCSVDQHCASAPISLSRSHAA
jgi:hypothetical protein